MARHNISERLANDVEEAVEGFENFTATQAWRDAVIEIYDETYDVGGLEAVDALEGYVESLTEDKRHPTSARLREIARHVLQEQESEIPATSSLLRSRNG